MSNENKGGAQRADKSAAAPVVDGAKVDDKSAAAPVVDGAPETPEAKAARVAENKKKDKAAAKARDRRAKEKEEKEAAEAAEIAAKAKRGHFIAEGKSVTSKKGIVSAGDKVDASYWDEKTFKKLVDSNVIIHVK